MLLGNRDINKMKLTSEVDKADVYDRDPETIPGPFWDPSAMSPAQYLQEAGLPNTHVNRLKYVLEKTMVRVPALAPFPAAAVCRAPNPNA